MTNKRYLILLWILIFSLVACEQASDKKGEQANDELRIELDSQNLLDFYFLEEFDITELKLTVFLGDQVIERHALDLSMINEVDQEKLSEVGKHQIEVEYEGLRTEFQLVLRQKVAQFFEDPTENTLARQYRYVLVEDRETINPLFFEMNFPLGLGLPQLTEEEIHGLIGQPIDVLRRTITTVFDLYAYLLAANFNKDYHSEVDTMNNWYYHERFDMNYFIFESAELALAMNFGGCAGLASVVHFILEENYDHIGFLWYYTYDQGGHSFNYIEHNGLYYIIDFTQFRGIWQETGNWFRLDYFPVIYQSLEDWVEFNVSFRQNNQASQTDFYARFEGSSSYIPQNLRFWDLDNTHFYVYHNQIGNPANRFVRFNTQRELLEALQLTEDVLWFKDMINLDE